MTDLSKVKREVLRNKDKIFKDLNGIIKYILDKKTEIIEKEKQKSIKNEDSEDEIEDDEIWFRGVSKLEHELIPNAYRDPIISYDKGWNLYDIFESYIPMFLKKGNVIEPKNIFDLYFLAQHYGMRTRLLDWTRSLTTAIFFAMYSYIDGGKYRCKHRNNKCSYKGKCFYPTIWILNASNMNAVLHRTHPYPVIPDPEKVASKWFKKDDMPDNPLAIFPTVSNERILAQQGVFTIHGKLEKPLDNIIEHYQEHHSEDIEEKKDKILDLIIIDPNSIEKIIDDLNTLGINEMTEFPELQSVTKHILREFYKHKRTKK
jgi:FRG domain